MSDFKSKLPDFKELSSMTSKLFKGLKNSVDEIISDYKEKRTESSKPAHSKSEKAEVKKEQEQKHEHKHKGETTKKAAHKKKSTSTKES